MTTQNPQKSNAKKTTLTKGFPTGTFMSNVHMLSGSSWCWYPQLEFVWGSCVCKSWESVEAKVKKHTLCT